MQLAQIKSPAQLTDIIQSLVTGSFEKKFKNTKSDDVITAFAFCTQGLSQDQLQTGIGILIEKAYCPDPALFRKWCLGQKDFTFDDEIADSYTNKHHALSQITKWQGNPSEPITMAMKQAYDDTYHLWQDIVSEADKTRAELAFKGAYEHIVKGLVKERIKCQAYVQPIMLTDEKPITPKKPIADKETAMAFLAKLKPALAKAVV